MKKNLLILGLALCALFAAWTWHKSEVKTAVKAAEQRVELSYRVALDEQRKRLLARSDASEKALQTKVKSLQRSKESEKSNNRSRVKSSANRVREQISSGSVRSDLTCDSRTQGTSPASNDLRLSATDAGLLVEWFAGATAELQTELKACVKQYNAVKQEIDNYKEGK